jgi:hypothetical protein
VDEFVSAMSGSPAAEGLNELREAVSQFDFETALTRLRQISAANGLGEVDAA